MADNQKSPEEASNLFHNIMKASVKGSTKPKKKVKTVKPKNDNKKQ